MNDMQRPTGGGPTGFVRSLRAYFAHRRDPAWLVQRADAAYRKGNPGLAARLYERALRFAADHVAALTNLAAIRIQHQAKFAQARELLERAAAVEPRNGTVRLNLGSLCANLGDWDAAKTHLEQGIRANPRQADLRFVLSYYFINSGDLEQAKRLLREELQFHPKSDRARQLLNQLESGALPSRPS